MYRFESFKKILTPKRTVSIKRTGYKISQRFLLNVLYNLKFGGLNSLTHCPYNRNHRVFGTFVFPSMVGPATQFLAHTSWH